MPRRQPGMLSREGRARGRAVRIADPRRPCHAAGAQDREFVATSRATTSVARAAASRRLATARRMVSPAACPKRSLIPLNPSRSSISRAPGWASIRPGSAGSHRLVKGLAIGYPGEVGGPWPASAGCLLPCCGDGAACRRRSAGKFTIARAKAPVWMGADRACGAPSRVRAPWSGGSSGPGSRL
jgi:hypothetical protein